MAEKPEPRQARKRDAYIAFDTDLQREVWATWSHEPDRRDMQLRGGYLAISMAICERSAPLPTDEYQASRLCCWSVQGHRAMLTALLGFGAIWAVDGGYMTGVAERELERRERASKRQGAARYPPATRHGAALYPPAARTAKEKNANGFKHGGAPLPSPDPSPSPLQGEGEGSSPPRARAPDVDAPAPRTPPSEAEKAERQRLADEATRALANGFQGAGRHA